MTCMLVKKSEGTLNDRLSALEADGNLIATSTVSITNETKTVICINETSAQINLFSYASNIGKTVDVIRNKAGEVVCKPADSSNFNTGDPIISLNAVNHVGAIKFLATSEGWVVLNKWENETIK